MVHHGASTEVVLGHGPGQGGDRHGPPGRWWHAADQGRLDQKERQDPGGRRRRSDLVHQSQEEPPGELSVPGDLDGRPRRDPLHPAQAAELARRGRAASQRLTTALQTPFGGPAIPPLWVSVTLLYAVFSNAIADDVFERFKDAFSVVHLNGSYDTIQTKWLEVD